jgi:hypothetical protein
MNVSLLLIAALLVTGSATPAAARFCDGEVPTGLALQSDDLRYGELRRGTTRSGQRRLDDEDGVSIGRGLGGNAGGNTGGMNSGGTGGLSNGGGLGNYGAGSLGERGPGGLGAMTGDSIHQPAPRPR